MYTLMFNKETIQDLKNHLTYGRQFFGAVIIPYSGVFTSEPNVYTIEVPNILCPYQVNDLIIIQERWARDASGEFIYEIDSGGSYDFRPAYTMPDEAARMYGKIVSAVPWLLNSSIADAYLVDNIDSCLGTAKVFGTDDVANRLLRKLRSQHNKSALSKTYQPSIDGDSIIKYVPYQLSQQVLPQLNFTDPSGEIQHLYASLYSDSAVAYYDLYNDPAVDPQRLQSGQAVDAEVAKMPNGDVVKNLASWTTYPEPLTIEEATKLEQAGYHLVQRGLAYGSTSKFIYVLLDNHGHSIPIYTYYPTTTVNSNQQVFVWLISGYLCDKEGNVIGDWW